MTVSSITEKTQAVEMYGAQAIDAIAEIPEEQVRTEESGNNTRTEMRTEEKKKEGGCAKVFSMILQIVAAVVAVVGGPKGIAIAAALNAAAKAIAPDPQTTAGASNSPPPDMAKIQREIDEAAAKAKERLGDYQRPSTVVA